MAIKLDAELLFRIVDKQPAAVLLAKWRSLSTGWCLDVLWCFAVHYRHRGLIEAIYEERNARCFMCKYSPLLTAAHDANYATCHMMASSTRYHMEDQYKGIVHGGVLTDRESSILDEILRHDNMDLLMDVCEGNVTLTFPLMNAARKANASNIRSFLENHLANGYRYLCSIQCQRGTEHSIKVLIRCIVNRTGTRTKLTSASAMMMWVQHITTLLGSHLSEEEKVEVRRIAAGGEFNLNDVIYPKDAAVSSLSLHDKVILDTFTKLLPSLPCASIPQLFNSLLRAALDILVVYLELPDRSDELTLCYFKGFIQIFLHTINVHSSNTPCRCGRLLLKQNIFKEFLQVFKRYESASQRKKKSRILAHGRSWLCTLLAHGCPQEAQEMMAAELGAVKSSLSVVRLCRSVLSHTHYEQYKIYGDYQKGFDAVRPLQDLCRVFMYEMLPLGKMHQVVAKLQISNVLKAFLTFGVKPLISDK